MCKFVIYQKTICDMSSVLSRGRYDAAFETRDANTTFDVAPTNDHSGCSRPRRLDRKFAKTKFGDEDMLFETHWCQTKKQMSNSCLWYDGEAHNWLSYDAQA